MNPKSKDNWDKASAIAPLAASLLAPLAVAVVGGLYGYWTKIAENRIKFSELAVSILRSEPKEELAPLRAWAIDTINETSPVPVSAEVRALLLKQKIPVSGVLSGNVTEEDAQVSGSFSSAPTSSKASR